MYLQHPEENYMMSSEKGKLLEAQELLQVLGEEKRLNENEISFISELLEEQSATIDVLKEENFAMKEKLPLHEEFLKYKEEASDTIMSLKEKLNDMQLKTLQLEKKLTQFGVDVVVLESSKIKELDKVNQQWQDKLKSADNQSKKIIEEIVKKHCEAKKEYEIVIHGLKEQISHKEAEVAWCQLMMQERDINIDKEMGTLKKELDLTTQKNQELLQQRILEAERRANKMTRKCLKLQQYCDNFKKEKDLQIQALQKALQHKAEQDKYVSEHKIEDAVKSLELRYRKIIISLHSAAQLQRQSDLKRISTLESAMMMSKMMTER